MSDALACLILHLRCKKVVLLPQNVHDFGQRPVFGDVQPGDEGTVTFPVLAGGPAPIGRHSFDEGIVGVGKKKQASLQCYRRFGLPRRPRDRA